MPVGKGQLTINSFFIKQKSNACTKDCIIVNTEIKQSIPVANENCSPNLKNKENCHNNVNKCSSSKTHATDKQNYKNDNDSNKISNSTKNSGSNFPSNEDSSSSNVFSFMMANRHKQKEGIQNLREKEKELAEAEELFPLILQAIPKESIFKWMKKTVNERDKHDCSESPSESSKSLSSSPEMYSSDNSTCAKFPSPDGLKSSLKRGKKKEKRSVKFCKFVMRHFIRKEEGEDTWQFICDENLNKEKKKYLQEQIEKLINIKDDDYDDFEDLFKDEINECLEGTPKCKSKDMKKLNKNFKNSTKANLIKDLCNVSDTSEDKENRKNSQMNISSFLKASMEKTTANNLMEKKTDADSIASLKTDAIKCSVKETKIDFDAKKKKGAEVNMCNSDSDDDIFIKRKHKDITTESSIAGEQCSVFSKSQLSNIKEPTSLRRSSRQVKQTNFFEIFSPSQPNMSNKRKSSLKNDSPFVKRKMQKTKSVEDFNSDDSIEIISEDIAEPKKLASIFLLKEQKLIASKKKEEIEKPKLSSVEIKARHDFLFSEEPVIMATVQKEEEEELLWPPIPNPSHVRQLSGDLPVNENSEISIQPKDKSFVVEKSNCLSDLINRANHKQPNISHPKISELEMYHILSHLREKDKAFPIIDTFKYYLDCKKEFLEMYEKESPDVIAVDDSLSKKRKRPSKKLSTNKKRKTDSLTEATVKSEEPIWQKWIPYCWTQVFAPKCFKHFIGNEAEALSIRTWLEEWKSVTVESQDCRFKRSYSSNSDFSDDNNLVNTVLLTGPSGIGKSCLVYALAQELGFKVLEINASSRRQGKQIIAQLSEATQSHTVSHNNSLAKDSSNDKFEFGKCQPIKKSLKCNKDRRDSSSLSSESEKKKKMALILFEDIDIVFEEYDDGFMSAVMNFMATTKRPIILTCTRSYPTLLEKIKENFIEHKLHFPSANSVANHLQLMCLANGVFASGKEIEHLVEANKGDIRSSILDLHFWSLSGSATVQWLKMDGKLRRSSSNDSLLDSDPLLEIIPKAPFKKSADVPILNGALWSKDISPLISMESRINSGLFRLDWHLIECNMLTLLPFNHNVVKQSPVYPLDENSPLIDLHLVKQRKDWLSYEISEPKMLPSHSPVKKVSSKVKAASNTCISSLSELFNTMTDLDILSANSKNDQWHNFEYVPSLNDTFSNSTSDSFSLIDTKCLSNRIAKSYLFKTNKSISDSLNNIEDSDGKLSASVYSSPLKINYCQSNCHRNERMDKVNKSICRQVASVCQPNTKGIILDYLPYLREMARSDEMGYAMKKLRRNKRFLSHLKFAGFYLNPDDCKDIANAFSLL